VLYQPTLITRLGQSGTYTPLMFTAAFQLIAAVFGRTATSTFSARNGRPGRGNSASRACSVIATSLGETADLLRTDWTPGSPIPWSGEWDGKPYEDKRMVVAVDEPNRFEDTH